jgi:hypothetical protein
LFGKLRRYYRQIEVRRDIAMTLLQVHVVLSLIGIASGFVMLYGLVTGRPFGGWTALFLATTILTSVTGFPLPPFGFDPPRAVGTLSLVLLAFAVLALYAFHLAGAWRWIYVVTAIASLYLNVFVGVIQAFLKVPAIHDLAPTQTEPPFLIAQGAVLLLFVVLGLMALKKFHPGHQPAAQRK